ncbi:MAG: hypothetical protein UHJ41_02880 [Bacteroidaceae bacterium]|nr:hypothetical protein [Bacteroidaceae bacterium]
MNGVKGLKITSKSNDNSIFLPAASWRYFTSLDDTGSNGNYWSRSLSASYSGDARYLYFSSSGIYTISNNRYYGRSVRPVRVQK